MTSSGVECSSGSGDKTDPTVNFDDPLYVHPSDNTVTSVIIFKLLGTENFRIWRSSMVRALKARNKLGFVDGTVSKPVKDPVKESKWERANAITCSWILGSISENLYANHACLESAYDLWNELNETYHKTDGSVIFNVHQKIVSHSQGSLSLSNYFSKLDSYWKEFDGLTNLTKCTCKATDSCKSH